LGAIFLRTIASEHQPAGGVFSPGHSVPEDRKMLKPALATALFLAASVVPLYAASSPMSKPTTECNAATIAETQTKADAIPNAAHKRIALRQLTLATDSLKAHKLTDCRSHLTHAMHEI
jgi:hypothetical protein